MVNSDFKEESLEQNDEECKICLSKTITEENLALVLESIYFFNKKTADELLNSKTDYQTAKQIIEDVFYTTQVLNAVVLDSTEAILALKDCDCANSESDEEDSQE